MTKQKNLDITMTEPQAEFMRLDCRYPLFTGGMGSGKSTTMTIAAFLDATHSPNATITIYEPTYQLVRDIATLFMEQFLTEHNMKYTTNKNEHSIVLENPQIGRFEFRSYDNPDLLIGYESYRSHVDEIDTLPKDKARIVWDRILSRTRQWPKGLPAQYLKKNKKTGRLEPHNRVSAYSTPEGFNFTYEQWAQNKNPEYQYVKARTSSNPFVASSYEESLRATYAGPLVDAYLNGEWVNMKSGSVYKCYDRMSHNSTETIRPGETLYIGCDFNVMHQAATIYVKRAGGHEFHAVAELCDMYDTPEMIEIIKERWQSKGHQIVMYPDCSGSARHAANASISDIALLKQAGFIVRAKSKNPPVKDRIAATNAAFTKGRLFINQTACPTVAKCLEQQSYNDNGEPDKKNGFDHQNDATTYPIAYEMMINKPLFQIPIKWVS